MRIIKIVAEENGAHSSLVSNAFTYANVPDGYAIVPDDVTLPETFPFVNIEVADGVVVSMTAGIVPEPAPEPEPEPTAEEKLRADVDFLMAMGGYVG